MTISRIEMVNNNNPTSVGTSGMMIVNITDERVGRVGAPWPSLRTLLELDRTKLSNVGRYLRLATALQCSKRHRLLIDRAVADCPFLRQILLAHPILFRPLMSGFLDSRLTLRQSFSAYAHDIAFTAKRVQESIPDFYRGEFSAPLWLDEGNGYHIHLALNLSYPQEGLWRIKLWSPDRQLIFSLCFSVLAGPTMFIGSVQGGRSSGEVCVAELIRLCTKQFEGVRPHFLLVEVLRALCSQWGIVAIRGVSQRHQLKVRSRSGSTTVQFSYDAFFAQLDGELDSDGNWSIPLRAAERQIRDAPSRKRAMYRRRITLISNIRESIGARLAVARSFRTESIPG